MADKMRVRVSFIVEVDPDEWAALNGPGNRWDIRAGIKAYIRSHVHRAPMIEDTGAEICWE